MTDSPVTHLVRDLSIDQQLAVRTAATRLHAEFSDAFGTDTIERFLYSSYDQFAGRATVPNFLPLLAERFARQRLRALAKVEGKVSDGKPTVLFLYTHNAGRSQMALGYFTHLAGDQATAWSGGSEPGNEINPAAIAAMAEVVIDITGEYPKPWTDEIVQAADVVITMGCGDACAQSSPGNATRTGTSPIPPAKASTRCAPSGTPSKVASAACLLNSTSPSAREPTHGIIAMTAHVGPTVLFVCVSNAGKSVMAQGLMRHTAQGRINALSAGTHAKTEVNHVSAQALAEVGIDISDHTPTQLNDALIDAADLIVVLGTQAHLQPTGTPIEVWDTDEPSLRGIDGIERMRLIRDDIANRVEELASRLPRP
ncbi:hypothetical protein BH09ACT8_BH09ACT8_58690 [soil metagenome]